MDPFESLDVFTQSYVNAMFFTESDVSLQNKYFSDFSEALIQKIKDDCYKFQTLAKDFITEENNLNCDYCADTIAGHDFWFTRNYTSSGFKDGDWRDSVSAELYNLAKEFGQFEIYEGDDNKVYVL